MPAVRRHPTTRHRDRRTNDPNYERRVGEALTTGEYTSFRDAATSTGIPKSTLIDRGKGRHNSHKIVSAKRQLLTPGCLFNGAYCEAKSGSHGRLQTSATKQRQYQARQLVPTGTVNLRNTHDSLATQSCDISSLFHTYYCPSCPHSTLQPTAGPSTANPTYYYYPYPTPFNPSSDY